MITIFGRGTSSNVQSVMWGAAEMGLTVDRVDRGESFGGLDTPEFRAMNPVGRIPVLKDGDVTIFESAAILRYMAARYGGVAFWPQDPGQRGRMDQWAEWAKRDVADLFTGPIFWRVVRTPEARHDKPAIAAAVAKFEDSLAIADAQLARHAWLAGPELSLGDFHLGHILYRYYDIDIARGTFPHVRRYYDRLTQRPLYAAHVMWRYDMLKDTI